MDVCFSLLRGISGVSSPSPLVLTTIGICSVALPWVLGAAVPSAVWGVLLVPFARTSARQNRAFFVVGRSVWKGLPLVLRLLPQVHSDMF